MKNRNFIPLLGLIILATLSTGFGDKTTGSKIKKENISYTVSGKVYKAFVAYDENLKGKRPAVLVVHEWWGLTDYPKMRAIQLAKLGYIAMAVDMFGNGKVAVNPAEAQAYAAPFYNNPQLSKDLIDAATGKIKEYKQTDHATILAIGYCFGGSVLLNAAKMGSNLKGVVSFHGGLKGVPADKNLLKARILVCHGASDKFVGPDDVVQFKHQMDSIDAKYTFIVYPNATHAFTNPMSTENGKKFNMPIEYNKKADMDSWNDMLKFFRTLGVK